MALCNTSADEQPEDHKHRAAPSSLRAAHPPHQAAVERIFNAGVDHAERVTKRRRLSQAWGIQMEQMASFLCSVPSS